MAPSRWIPKASALRIVRPMSENKLRMLNRSMEAACEQLAGGPGAGGDTTCHVQDQSSYDDNISDAEDVAA